MPVKKYSIRYAKKCYEFLQIERTLEEIINIIDDIKTKKRLKNRELGRKYDKLPNRKIGNLLKKRIRCALKRSKSTKSFKTQELIGCSIEELKIHLESLFKPGMTWENRGVNGWHIDHIRPCVSFNLSDPEQQKQCFHYTNLQPLWAEENMSKNSWWNGVLFRNKK